MASHHEIPPTQVHEVLAKHMLVDGFHLVMDMEMSHGSWIYDATSNVEILDGYTSFATIPIGYNHPKLSDPTFKKNLFTASVNKIANADIYTSAMAGFVETFSKTLPEQYRKHLFFISGGALAVENSLKVAFDWKVRKNIAKGIVGEKGSKIIHFKVAFHGRSGYTMSLTNTELKKTQYFPKFDWPRIINPKLSFKGGVVPDDVLQKVIEVEKLAVQQIHQALKDNPNDVAALIVETIQGEGGDNHFRPEFLKELRKIADENEFLLIFDEIQCGFGTSGKWWAFEHFGVHPDIIVFGKKTQICGIAVTTRIDDVDNVFKISSRINSTWGGNIADMVRCQKYIEIILEDKLLDNAAQVGEQILASLVEFEKKFPGIVTNARGRGMFMAIDLPDTETRNKAIKEFYEHNMLTLSSGTRSLRLRPALSMTKEEGYEFIKRMDKTFHHMFTK